jgi:hypothetical protein
MAGEALHGEGERGFVGLGPMVGHVAVSAFDTEGFGETLHAGGLRRTRLAFVLTFLGERRKRHIDTLENTLLPASAPSRICEEFQAN